MSQYKVPQNIDMQDKIIGPLTLIQFIYLMAGGMIIYIFYETLEGGIFYLIAFPAGFLALALAFLKVQDQPFSKFLLSLLYFLTRPKKQVWYKIPESEKFAEELKEKKKEEKQDSKDTHKKVEKSELEKLALLLDTQGLPQDQKKKQTASKTKATKNKKPKNELKDIFGE